MRLFLDYTNLLDVIIGVILAALWGLVLVRKSIIIIFMSIELLLLAINMNFLLFVLILDDGLGLLYILIVLTVAAAEAAVGLAILVVFYRLSGVIELNKINVLK